MNMFSSEDNVVEIRSIKNPANPVYFRKIREYLNRLKLLSYSDVKFTAFEITISDNLTLGKDNKYYGTASFCQKFEADEVIKVNESIKVKTITDITCKRVQIIVEKVDGFNEEIWRVFLGDISVDDYQIN